MFQNLLLIHIDLPAGPAIWYKWKSRDVKPFDKLDIKNFTLPSYKSP